MKQMKMLLSIVAFVAISLTACKEGGEAKNYPTLKASLDVTEMSLSEIFKRIKIIPLEGSIESFITQTNKMEIMNDTIFILDDNLKTLFVFDADGRFINKISRVGHAGNEYLELADFTINKYDNTLLLLDHVTSAINEYDKNGNFIRKIKLPRPPMYRYGLALLDSVNYVTFATTKDQNVLSFFSLQDSKERGGYFSNSGIWFGFQGGSVFHRYKEDTYYHEAFSGKVYRIAPQGYEIAYEWDLGVIPMDPEKLAIPTTSSKQAKKIEADWRDGTIPFSFIRQLQSDNYYCTTLMDDKVMLKNILYNKNSGKSITIGDEDCVVQFRAECITDEYLLGFVTSKDNEAFREYVLKNGFELSGDLNNDDNPLLIKMYFGDHLE